MARGSLSREGDGRRARRLAAALHPGNWSPQKEKVRHLAWRCKGWVLSTFGGPKENRTSRSFTLKPPCEGKELSVSPPVRPVTPSTPPPHPRPNQNKCSFPSFPGCSYPQSVSLDLQGLCSFFFFGKHRGFTSDLLLPGGSTISLDKIPNTACRHSHPTPHIP